MKKKKLILLNYNAAFQLNCTVAASLLLSHCILSTTASRFLSAPEVLLDRATFRPLSNAWQLDDTTNRLFKVFAFADVANASQGGWADASRYCMQQKGTLATLHSNSEHKLIQELLEKSVGDKSCWFGLHKAFRMPKQNETSWIWIDNVDALPTRERQPLFPTPDILKNVFSAFSLVERCGTVSSKGWGQRPCSGRNSGLGCFVCVARSDESQEDVNSPIEFLFSDSSHSSPEQLKTNQSLQNSVSKTYENKTLMSTTKDLAKQPFPSTLYDNKTFNRATLVSNLDQDQENSLRLAPKELEVLQDDPMPLISKSDSNASLGDFSKGKTFNSTANETQDASLFDEDKLHPSLAMYNIRSNYKTQAVDQYPHTPRLRSQAEKKTQNSTATATTTMSRAEVVTPKLVAAPNFLAPLTVRRNQSPQPDSVHYDQLDAALQDEFELAPSTLLPPIFAEDDNDPIYDWYDVDDKELETFFFQHLTSAAPPLSHGVTASSTASDFGDPVPNATSTATLPVSADAFTSTTRTSPSVAVTSAKNTALEVLKDSLPNNEWLFLTSQLANLTSTGALPPDLLSNLLNYFTPTAPNSQAHLSVPSAVRTSSSDQTFLSTPSPLDFVKTVKELITTAGNQRNNFIVEPVERTPSSTGLPSAASTVTLFTDDGAENSLVLSSLPEEDATSPAEHSKNDLKGLANGGKSYQKAFLTLLCIILSIVFVLVATGLFFVIYYCQPKRKRDVETSTALSKSASNDNIQPEALTADSHDCTPKPIKPTAGHERLSTKASFTRTQDTLSNISSSYSDAHGHQVTTAQPSAPVFTTSSACSTLLQNSRHFSCSALIPLAEICTPQSATPLCPRKRAAPFSDHVRAPPQPEFKRSSIIATFNDSAPNVEGNVELGTKPFSQQCGLPEPTATSTAGALERRQRRLSAALRRSSMAIYCSTRQVDVFNQSRPPSFHVE